MEVQKYSFMDLSFPSEMTKKDCKQQGVESAQEIINGGEHDLHEVMSNVSRLLEVGKSFEKEIRDELTNEQKEKDYIKNGVTFSLRSTGDRLDYEQDPIYKDLKDRLKAREDLLKTAYKSKETIYDSDGVDIPKVGIKTHGKESLTVKF